MSFVLLGILNSQAAGGGAGSVYRFQIIEGADTEIGYGFSDYLGGGVYSGWTNSVGSTESGLTVSVAKDGTLNWSTRLYTDSGDKIVNLVDNNLDDSGNVYVAGRTSDVTGIPQYVLLAHKYNSSGVLQWQKALSNAPANAENYGSTLDSNGDFILSGSDGNQDCILTKYSASGTLIWQKEVDFGGTNFFYNVKTDASNNIYAVGFGGELKNEPVVVKLNSSGVLQWAKSIDINGRGHGIDVDPSGNVYISGRTESYDFGFVAKLNSSGTLQWQRKVNGTNTNNQFYDLAVDSNGDILACGQMFQTITGSPLVKFDSSGNVIYQRFIRGTTNLFGWSMRLDANENPMVGGFTNNNYFGAVLPTDGSLTGSYSVAGDTIVYEAGSLTVATSTYTFNDVTPAVTSAGLSVVTPTLLTESTIPTVNTVEL